MICILLGRGDQLSSMRLPLCTVVNEMYLHVTFQQLRKELPKPLSLLLRDSSGLFSSNLVDFFLLLICSLADCKLQKIVSSQTWVQQKLLWLGAKKTIVITNDGAHLLSTTAFQWCSLNWTIETTFEMSIWAFSTWWEERRHCSLEKWRNFLKLTWKLEL